MRYYLDLDFIIPSAISSYSLTTEYTKSSEKKTEKKSFQTPVLLNYKKNKLSLLKNDKKCKTLL